MKIPAQTFRISIFRYHSSGLKRRWMGLFTAIFLGLSCAGFAEPKEFQFHHDAILGTSLDLQVVSEDASQAAAVEAAVLQEIERLRKILSTYDPASEVSRFNAITGDMKCSPELLDVLSFYDFWTARSGGAYNGHLGELIAAWKAALRFCHFLLVSKRWV